MTKVSNSPQRHSFQKEGYIKRQKEKNEPINEDYVDWFKTVIDSHASRFDDIEKRTNNMEYDLLTTDWILEKTRNSDVYAQNLYAAMCNNDFIKNEVWPLLTENTWSCSWRYAGGIIADMQQDGDYIDWYCSGIKNNDVDDEQFQQMTKDQQEHYLEVKKHVPEGMVTDEIRSDLLKLGWVVVDNKDNI